MGTPFVQDRAADDGQETVPQQFPDPVEPPNHVAEARFERLEELQKAAAWGIGLRLSVVAVEFVAVWYWGYAALLVDAVASLFDVAASLAIVVAVRLAARPPDENHPFGHGRYEPLAGLQLSVLIAAAGLWLAVQFISGAVTAEPAGYVSPWAWVIPLCAAVAVETASRIVWRIGERQQSAALIAEARHYRIDAVTSLLAAIGLLAASQSPELAHRIDLGSAGVLAMLMIWIGLSSASENLHQLLDRAPEDEHFVQVRASALEVPGVLGVEKLRIQHAGPDAHVNIDIEVDPDMSVVDAHEIAQQVRARIQADWPVVQDVLVHIEPYYAGDH